MTIREGELTIETDDVDVAVIRFFQCFIAEIEKEDRELHELFVRNKNKYDISHGVWILYETTFVYLALKGALRQNYPYRAMWERQYPNDSNKHADIGIVDQNNKDLALIEFKFWYTKENKIEKEIAKLQTCESCERYLIIIGDDKCIYGESLYLTEKFKDLVFLTFDSVSSHIYQKELGKNDDFEIYISLYKVK